MAESHAFADTICPVCCVDRLTPNDVDGVCMNCSEYENDHYDGGHAPGELPHSCPICHDTERTPS